DGIRDRNVTGVQTCALPICQVPRIVDALNTGNLTAIDEVFDAGYVDRTPNPGTTPDREGFKQGLTKFRAAFPDFRYTIEDEIVEIGRASCRERGKLAEESG